MKNPIVLNKKRNMSKTYSITVTGVDLDLLREQKQELLLMFHRTDSDNNPICRPKELVAIDGVIGLIDAIQDAAVEQHGLDESEVFKFSNE